MAFILDNFGADTSNVKASLGGVKYFRYFNKNNDTITNAGYFPAELGLEVGDRLCVTPATVTDADAWYVVSDTTNRIVTVTELASGGSVDLSKVVNADVLPTADAESVNKVYLYTGATDATYTHGYVYECQATPVYDSTVEFNPASLSSTTVACSGSDFAALVARWGTGDIDTIIKGTLTYDESGELLVFVGQDDTNTTVCTFQLYVQDYVDAGFTFTGTFQDGDVIAFTCTIVETGATYAWARIDTQPQPAKELPTQAGNSGKYLKTNGVSASWAAVESLPDQSGQSGKFLTTNGSVASWDTTIDNALIVSGASNQIYLMYAKPSANDLRAVLSFFANTNILRFHAGSGVFYNLSSSGFTATIDNARDLGGTGIGFKTAYVHNLNNGADIAVPTTGGTMVVATPPTADGTYTLKATVSSGVVTYTWVAE